MFVSLPQPSIGPEPHLQSGSEGVEFATRRWDVTKADLRCLPMQPEAVQEWHRLPTSTRALR